MITPPTTVTVITTEIVGNLMASVEDKVSKGDPDYSDAVEWWLFVNGHPPQGNKSA